MEAFFIRVMIAVVQNKDVQAWAEGVFSTEADKLRADIGTKLDQLETTVISKLEQLPGEILGDATKDVGRLLHEITGTTDQIAGAVKGQVSPLLPTVDSLQAMLGNALKNIPGGNILGGFFGQ